MTAVESAAQRVRRGQSPALAVTLAAIEYGVDRDTVAAEMGRRGARRRSRHVSRPPEGAWWNE